MSYVIEWTSTTVERHKATVDAETLASMIGVPVADVVAAGADGVRELYHGTRSLENGLADIEGDDTSEGVYEFTRYVESVTAEAKP